MKNFTNNFKQFTSRLSARWLIMALMLLVGTSSLWAKYTIYYVNVNGWTNPYCYAWILNGSSEATWAGKLMTKTGEKCLGYDVYKYDGTNDSSNRCIFSNNGANQTGDLTINKGKYYYNDKWYASISEIESEFGIDYLEILKGNKIAFYIGEPSSWGQSKFYLRKNSTTKASTNITFISGSNRLGVVSAAAETGLYVTHSESWQGEKINQAPVAGGAYLCNDGDSYSGCQNLNTTALSYSFTLTKSTIKAGETCAITEGTKPTTYQGNSTTIRYFVTTDKTNFTELVLTNGALQTGNLAVGTYTIRPLITDGIIYAIGTDKTLTVETSCEEPTITLTNNTVTYNGNAQKPTITIDGGATPTKVKYNGTEYANGPTNAGTYTVTVWADENGDYCSLEGEEAGDFIITQKTPTDADFTYTESKTYTGSALGADVKWVANTGTGAITTYYKKQGAADNTYTTNAPTDAGTYTIAVTTVAQGNYGVVSKLPLDDFEIKKANQTLTISNSTTSLCESEVTLTTSGGPGKGSVSFEITANTAGATINGNTLTATQSGSVTVVATKAADDNYNAATSEAKTFTFTLLSAPTFIATSATACKKTAFNLNDKFTRNDGGAGTLEWYTVTGGTKVNNPESVTISETTTYYAKVKEGSCYSANSVNVTVNIYTPGISSITITPSTNSITVKATITGSDLQSMQVEVAEDGDWANAIQGTTAVNGSGSFTCSVNGLQEGTAYKVRVGANTKTCPALFTYADVQEVTTLCNTIAAPAIKTEATICPYTDTPLSNFNNGVANVVWYANDACTQNVTEANITKQTTYYARIEQGTCASPAATLTLSVYPAPEVPILSFSQKTVGQGKTTILTINEYSDDNTYVVYQSADNKIGSDTEVGKYTAPMNISHANTGTYYYYAIATSNACSNLTTTSNELVALTVVESGVKINYLGSTTLYKNDPTHFVPMYVKLEGVADAGADAVQSFTWQYSADGSTGWTACNNNHANFNATNNKSDKKVVATNGSEKCNNWRASAVGYYRCLITYDNQETATSNVIQVTEGTNNNTNKQHIGITYNLPIISVNTGSKSFPSDCGLNGYPSKFADDLKAKISVDVKIFNPDGTVCYDRKARMNYRGSSSLNFKKKSYAFVTGKEKTKNDKGDVDTGKANLFGLSNGAEDKDWVLYAATPDPSMMRNRLTFDLYKEMTGKWGVSSMYVELVINGEYKGVYVLMDKVTNNENRVNITSNSGFIVKFDKTDLADRVEKDGDQKTFATTRTGTGVDGRHPNGIDSYGTKIDQRFEIEYPEKEDIEDAGGNWTETYTIIKDRFEEFEAALAEKDYPTVRKLIDYDSWADWFIISEYIKNQDTYRASNIFVFNGDKIEAWPLWDQELSFNNQTRTAHGSTSTTGLMATTQSIYEDAFKAVFWLTGGDADDKGGLLGDPCFVALVKSKWEAYKANQLSASNVSTKVTAFGNELGKAQEREQARWPYSGDVRGLTCDGGTIGYYGKNEGQAVGYSTSVSAINTWATNRVNGFTNALNAYTTEDLIFGISPETTPATPWQPVILIVSVPEGFEYDIAYPELTAAGAIVTKTKDMYQVKIPRPTGDGWTIGGNGTDKNGQATAQTKTFTVTASITKSTENACGSVNKDKVTSTITLQDVTEACNPEIVKP